MKNDQIRKMNLVVFWRAVIFIMLVCLSLLATTAWQVWDARVKTLQAADIASANLTESLALHAQGAFEQIDTLLHELEYRIDQKQTGPAQSLRLQEYTRRALEIYPQLEDLMVLDASGSPAFKYRESALNRSVLLALMRFHKQPQVDEASQVGGEFKNYPAGPLFMTISRKIKDDKGRFAGVLVATVRSDYFSRYYARINVGTQGFIALQTTAGVIVAEKSEGQPGIMRTLPHGGSPGGYYAKNLDGTLTLNSPVDGLRRHYTYRNLSLYPLRLVVSVTENHILSGWRHSAWIQSSVTGILIFLLALGGYSLVRQVRERSRSELGLFKSLKAVHILEQALNEHALVSVTDINGKILRVNDTFCKVSRYSREELVGRDHGILNSGHHSAEFMDSLWQSLQAGEVWRGDIRNRAKDGSFYWVSSTIVPFFDEKGEAYQYVSIRTVITERKEAEISLATAQQALEENNRTLVELALRDGLTGIANRRGFDLAIHSELRRAIRERQPLSVLMIDVDYFKQFNDLYGHVAGDQILKQIAAVIRSYERRAGDLVARYGGEEFTVLLPNTSGQGALHIAEKIRAEVEMLKIPHASSQFSIVTVSIGAYTAIPVLNETTEEELVQRADAGLYVAKRSGRNQVHSAETQAQINT